MNCVSVRGKDIKGKLSHSANVSETFCDFKDATKLKLIVVNPF